VTVVERTALTRGNSHSKFRWWKLAVSAVLILGPTALGIFETSNGVFRDELDIYSQFMISPFMLVFPLLICVVSCSGVFSEFQRRYVVNTRSRMDARRYLFSRIIGSSVAAFAIGFASAAFPAVVAFAVWPRVGDPRIDPSVYQLNAATAMTDAVTRYSFTDVLVHGTGVYGLAYSAWVGIIAAGLAATGVLSLVLMKNKVLAMLVPMLIYFTETLLASFASRPQLGLMFSAFPFGLEQQPLLVAALPGILLVTGVTAVFIRTISRAPTLESLS
jgi:hypothetical protein